MRVTIQHYGALRKLGHHTVLDISAPATLADVRAAFIARSGDSYRLLIEDSVLANDTDILPDECIIEADCTLSVLPPVCGG